ncbi:MAG: TlpA family protein disulfide reductase [Flavobacteriaceae bacterium]|jgi:thiol-disulfide isomerase/thioredoxin|nr:TlpA family protein disulfide reductase [Flavobacteriaceae bacterium]
MKKPLIIIGIILVATVFIIYNFGIQIGNVKIGKQQDEISNHHKNDFENSAFYKNQLHGEKPVVMNLWATWCVPCIEEMPNFKQLQKENPDVDFVFLSIDTDSAKLQNYLAKNPEIKDITFENRDYRKSIRNFLEDRDLNSLIKTEVVPITYFINEGKVKNKMEGSLEMDELKKLIEQIKTN